MDDVECDRISDLPLDVINIILSRIPLRDAVRTSVLSSKWKLHWTRTESLVVDDSFFYNVISIELEDEMRLPAYVKIVKDILLSHRGPVRKFHLYVPSFGDTPASDVINLLIHYVSRFGVHDLTLEFEEDEEDYEFPYSVFRCVELKHLSLKFGESFLSYQDPMELPTHDFRKLSSLVSLDLCRDRDLIHGDEVTNIISNCPLLERPCLDYNGTSEPLVINAPKLKFLSVSYGYHMDFSLKNTLNISTLSMRKKEALGGYGIGNIVDFFSAVPKVESINLNGYVLVDWDPKKVPERLPASLENNLSFTVSDLNIYSLPQIRSMICLINSSPKLQTLDISICQPEDKPEATGIYLISQLKEAKNLAGLRTVKISGLGRETLEKLFFEFILAICPNSQELCLRIGDHIIGPDVKSKMMEITNQIR